MEEMNYSVKQHRKEREKVDEKWLKKNGWECQVDDVDVFDADNHTVIKHHTVYVKGDTTGKGKRKFRKIARWDHFYTRYYGERSFKLVSTSNYYQFQVSNAVFIAKNNISHRKYDAENIKAALKLCGIE